MNRATLREVFSSVLTEAGGKDLFDVFPKTEQEFNSVVDRACKHDYGPRYRDAFDHVQGFRGAIDKFMKALWEGNWTAYEAVGEIGMIFDVMTDFNTFQGGPAAVQGLLRQDPGQFQDIGYAHLRVPQNGEFILKRSDAYDLFGDWHDRPFRPLSKEYFEIGERFEEFYRKIVQHSQPDPWDEHAVESGAADPEQMRSVITKRIKEFLEKSPTAVKDAYHDPKGALRFLQTAVDNPTEAYKLVSQSHDPAHVFQSALRLLPGKKD